MPTVRLLCGPARSGRCAAIDDIARAHWSRMVLLTPTRQNAQARAERLILEDGLPGCWGRPVVAYNQFVLELLEKEGRFPTRLDDFERQLLLRQALASFPGVEMFRPGLYVQMLRVINELKQAAIEPDEFRRLISRAQDAASFDQMVAEAYTAYQRALRESGRYDLPGIFWEADLVCRAKRPAILDGIDALLVDGFDDFTPSEFKLLGSLSAHVELLVFGLPCSDEPSQGDLYMLPLDTAEKIQAAFHCARESFEDAPARTCAQFAARHMLWRDRPAAPAALTSDLVLSARMDALDEVEFVARRIKHLLVEQRVPCDRVAIVYRRLDGVTGLIRAVCAECGIPVRVMHEPALWESSVCGYLYNFLDVIETWERERVVDVLTSPWFVSDDAGAHAVPVLSCAARIVSGRSEWQEKTAALEAALGKGDIESVLPPGRIIPQPRAAVEGFLNRLRRFTGWADRIPENAPPAQFIKAVESLIEQMDLNVAIQGHAVDALRESEQAALDAFRRALRVWHAWERDAGAVCSRAEFVARLRHALETTTFRMKRPADGVACLDAESVRHMEFDYVFFCGLNEGAVPGPPLRNAVYSEQDVARLARAGITLDSKQLHSRRESLLFHHVLNAARKQLTLTWRRLDERAREIYPSPYVQDIIELFEQNGARPEGGPAVAHGRGFVPEFDEAASWRDVSNRAFFERHEVARAIQDRFPGIAAAVEVAGRRDSSAPFDGYDGVLSDAALVGGIAREYGPEHLFSVNQIETYAECPFRFFTERLLHIEPTEAPVTEFDALTRGQILHEALQRFYSGFRGRRPADIPETDAADAMNDIVATIFQNRKNELAILPKGVTEVEKRRIIEQLLRHISIERNKKDEWAPTYFEVCFGQRPQPDAPPPNTPEPFVMRIGEERVKFTGRIDRIDMGASGVRLIDYKSSAVIGNKDVTDGRSIQLVIYAMATESILLPGHICQEAHFVPIGSNKWLEVMHRTGRSPNWPERQAVAEGTVASALAGIRRGAFVPTGGDWCRYCDFSRLCRYQEARMRRKMNDHELDRRTAAGD